jgi:hypothetical protein
MTNSLLANQSCLPRLGKCKSSLLIVLAFLILFLLSGCQTDHGFPKRVIAISKATPKKQIPKQGKGHLRHRQRHRIHINRKNALPKEAQAATRDELSRQMEAAGHLLSESNAACRELIFKIRRLTAPPTPPHEFEPHGRTGGLGDRLNNNDLDNLKRHKEALLEGIKSMTKLKANLGDSWTSEAETLLMNLKEMSTQCDGVTKSLLDQIRPPNPQ